MEQMYMVEIFIDKVTIFLPEGEESAAAKKLIVKIKFGPKTQFIIKEGHLAPNDNKTTPSLIECDEQNRRKFTRTVRIGNSLLFPSYPDTVLKILSKFPLEIEVWTDDQNEVEEFVGVGIMLWDTQFFFMLKETAEACKRVEPLSIKQKTPLKGDCGCKQVGEIQFILRLSALGESIITEFQQLMSDPDRFVFRTNRAPSMFECKRIEDGNPNFCMVGSLYETTTLEDPTLIDNAQQKIEICTELQSCGIADVDKKNIACKHNNNDDVEKKKYTIDKIRMGDITGPCGNTNCPLAHKVRTYLRNLDIYKKEAEGKVTGEKDYEKTKNICGACSCKDDRWHREDCTEGKKDDSNKEVCKNCGGQVKKGHNCEARQNRTGSKTTIAYVFNVTKVPEFKDSLGLENDNMDISTTARAGGCGCGQRKLDTFKNDAIDLNQIIYNNFEMDMATMPRSSGCGCGQPKFDLNKNDTIIYNSDLPSASGNCCCKKSKLDQIYKSKDPKFYNNMASNPMSGCGCSGMSKFLQYSSNKDAVTTNGKEHEIDSQASPPNMANHNKPLVYNIAVSKSKADFTPCTGAPELKDCKCNPPKPRPPCSTFDCECIPEMLNKAARKQHKPYCPSYKHKATCPVTKMYEEQDEEKKKDEDEDEPEALPYGLPPIELGPCPVMGRPCTVPDGFARMYKTAALAALPPSYSEAGKVCCTREYERIKKALKEYMKYEKDHDMRCVNKFDVDTERRCCDKEQMLLAMSGKGCCGTHKLDIQEKFKDK